MVSTARSQMPRADLPAGSTLARSREGDGRGTACRKAHGSTACSSPSERITRIGGQPRPCQTGSMRRSRLSAMGWFDAATSARASSSAGASASAGAA
eukprot:6365764-Prymnesium_polylepis.1